MKKVCTPSRRIIQRWSSRSSVRTLSAFGQLPASRTTTCTAFLDVKSPWYILDSTHLSPFFSSIPPARLSRSFQRPIPSNFSRSFFVGLSSTRILFSAGRCFLMAVFFRVPSRSQGFFLQEGEVICCKIIWCLR